MPNGPRTVPQVSLTYHANGDPTMASRCSTSWGSAGVHVTVFGVGSWLVENPKLVARMVAEGHEVANHTWSHPTMGPLGRATIATEITRCAEALTTLTGSPARGSGRRASRCPPRLILEEAGKAGYRTSVGYDSTRSTSRIRAPRAVMANVEATVQPGSIISVHFGHANTLAALPGLLDMLAAKGLEPVTVGQLLA